MCRVCDSLRSRIVEASARSGCSLIVHSVKVLCLLSVFDCIDSIE